MELTSAQIKQIQAEAATKKGFREQLLKEVEKIEGLPDMKRWRAIKDLLLRLNPAVKAVDDKFIADLKATKDAQLNQFGSSKEGHIRQLLDMPTYLYQVLMIADQDFNYNVNISHDRELQKRTWRRMAKTFPEYAIARSI